MEINLLAFGQIAEITGKSSWKMAGIKDTENLIHNLEEEFPSLMKMKYSLAVNKIIIQHKTVLNESDTVALLPPFSGG